ncbi:MAG: hypothetical protein R2724_17430 [Bryobacterales bacterium]
MREAARLAQEGAAEGTSSRPTSRRLVEAGLAGNGAQKQAWDYTFRSSCGPQSRRRPRPPSRSPAASALPRGVGDAAGVVCDIRWPNDVMLNEKKLAGILVEMTADADRLRYVIVGVGINVNQQSVPPELADIATSLRIETGCDYLRDSPCSRRCCGA